MTLVEFCPTSWVLPGFCLEYDHLAILLFLDVKSLLDRALGLAETCQDAHYSMCAETQLKVGLVRIWWRRKC